MTIDRRNRAILLAVHDAIVLGHREPALYASIELGEEQGFVDRAIRRLIRQGYLIRIEGIAGEIRLTREGTAAIRDGPKESL